MLKLEFAKDRKSNPYRKRETNNLVYVYNVIGDEASLKKYKELNPKAITDEKTKQVLHFGTKFLGTSCDMVENEKGFWPDTQELDMFHSLETQFGPTIAAVKMAEYKAGK